MENKYTIPVSVIVPVYNVYDWLDECMNSIVNQTFRDFEIILINDGSTDGSDQRCLQWQEKDIRVRYIDKKNEGVFITRNLGLRLAKGEYIIFIDSDDWLDLHYIEKMYNLAVETGADIIECDFWRYDNNTGNRTYRPCYGRMEKEYSLEEHIIYGESVLWKYMSKKSIWTVNNITIPNCLGSAHVVYVLLLVLGAKIVNIHEALYFYRRFRKGSILDINGAGSSEEGKMGLQELDILIDEFKTRNLYDKYENILHKIIMYRLSDLLAAQFVRRDEKEFESQFNNYYRYVNKRFPVLKNCRYFNIGGYNLNRILSYLPEVHNPYYRFNFSSIISIMHPAHQIDSCSHKNEYRKKMIRRDVGSYFWEILDQARPKYLFIDFLEERFDVIKMNEGGFITKSDAFDEMESNGYKGRIVKRDSDECQKQWEKDCIVFFEQLLNYFPAGNIILIENYLSEKKGNIYYQEDFNDLDTIKKTNKILKKYYDYFRQNCNGAKHIEAYNCDNYFTDIKYEYGAVPAHLNEVVNKEIAKEIKKCM